MSEWRNWQTRTIQVRMVQTMWVQVPSRTFFVLFSFLEKGREPNRTKFGKGSSVSKQSAEH